MCQSLKEVLQTKTKDELIDMYIKLVENTDNVYYELALTDPLTQVYNRRGAEARFKELEDNSNLKDKKLVFIDIDHFKQINDDLGHDWGDRALYVIASRIKDYFKDSIVIRFGGDEFLVITSADEKDIEKFDSICDKDPVTYNTENLHVTCSLGYVPYSNGISLQDWITQADAKMFKNKKKRNLNRLLNYI